ncbi:MAG: hypothetical protein AAB263_13160 [Planctomycetota bacterium]
MPTGLFRRHPTAIAIATCSVVALAGLLAFALALRDCHFDVPLGRCLNWSLIVRNSELMANGQPATPRATEHRVSLVSIGPGPGDTAWITGTASGPPQSLQLLRVPGDGRARLILPDGRSGDVGTTLAGFDFNLLPLPEGAEHEWRTDIAWAALPHDRRAVNCLVKRQRSGPRPEFRCEFPPSVEWIDPFTKRYRQVRGLIAIYCFDTLRGVPISATVTFRIFDEMPQPDGMRGREVRLELTWIGSSSIGNVARMRSIAQAGALAESLIAAHRTPPAELISRLRAADGPFAGIADGLLARLAAGRP